MYVYMCVCIHICVCVTHTFLKYVLKVLVEQNNYHLIRFPLLVMFALKYNTFQLLAERHRVLFLANSALIHESYLIMNQTDL